MSNELAEQLYDDAVKLVRDKKRCSASLLQRTFRVGYGTAMLMIDKMEANGVVGPAPERKVRKGENNG